MLRGGRERWKMNMIGIGKVGELDDVVMKNILLQIREIVR